MRTARRARQDLRPVLESAIHTAQPRDAIMSQAKHPLPSFDETLRARCREAALLEAGHIRQQQVWHTWPFWTADAGRIAHNISISNPTYRPTLALTWDCARSAQALLSVHKLTGDATALETA